MRRADRLFEIVQHLRGGRLRLARELAEALEVSTRTIYRDIADLIATGVPIEGAAGVGYILRPGFFLPPPALTPAEHQALLVGARLVSAWADSDLAAAAQEALIKLEAVGGAAPSTPIHSYGGRLPAPVRRHLRTARHGLTESRKLDLTYAKPGEAAEARRIRPLSLEFWGMVWTLTAWCERREDFRVFRLDRIESLTPTEARFTPEPGRTLADYLKTLESKTNG